MASTVASPRRYRHDPERAGLARSFAAWAARQGLAIQALSAEQCILLSGGPFPDPCGFL